MKSVLLFAHQESKTEMAASSLIFFLYIVLLLTWGAVALPLLFAASWDKAATGDLCPTDCLRKRSISTGHFKQQFSNPNEVLAVLLLLGGDVVRKAVAQLTGGPHATFTPVVFSFGWVSYAITLVANSLGDGTFLPKPDQPSLVITIGSADVRQNKSWRLGRLIRDLELEVSRHHPSTHEDSGLMITVYEVDAGKYTPLKPKKDWVWLSCIVILLFQLFISAIPWIWSVFGEERDWSIFLITACGNALAVLTASISGLRKGEVGARKHSRSSYAITRGNGSNQVFIIKPDSYEQNVQDGETTNVSKLPYLQDIATISHPAQPSIRILYCVLALFWIALLVATGGLQHHTWFLFFTGILGISHNILVSEVFRKPEAHGFPLRLFKKNDQPLRFGYNESKGRRPGVTQVLLELEAEIPGAGHALRRVFFTGWETKKDKELWGAEAVSFSRLQNQEGVYV